MSRPLFWPTAAFFYPLGNTSAVCLTENLPPESRADVLLLACGDPRHILYTIYAEEVNPLTRLRAFDVTCCDMDVAILARNAVLLTSLANDDALDKLDTLWNLFFHMLVDEVSLSLLFEQCQRLVALAESPETWKAGPYGHFLTTCDVRTLMELRRVWKTYLDTATLSPEQAKQFEKRFVHGMKEMSKKIESGTTTAATRSAGPFTLQANRVLADQFSHYWAFGTTNDDVQDQGRGLTVNPMFAFSIHGDKFSVHYGTDPLSGFHLAEAFASGKFVQSPQERIPIPEMVRVARDQFSRWCTSLSGRLRDDNPRFIVRMFGGDALTFCQALRYCGSTGSPVTPYNIAPWRLSTISFDDHFYGRNAVSPAPLSFNMIDTSNLLDHAGLINTLVVTAPLLAKMTSATLYTDAWLRMGSGPCLAFHERLCGDFPMMALLLGIVPFTLLTQFGTRSSMHETLTTSEGERLYHERLAWKPISFEGPTMQQHLCFCPKDLAALLFHIYFHMFSNEDISSQFEYLLRAPEHMDQVLQHFGTTHHNRRSFALLVHLAKMRVQTDWPRAMDMFEFLVSSDQRLMSGRHAYQELFCQLHLIGVNTPEWLSLSGLHDFRLKHGGDNTRLFRSWTPSCIPQVLTLVFVVPRDAITGLEPDFKDFGMPVLQCDLHKADGESWFAVMSATFGTLHVFGKGEHRTGVIVEGHDDTYTRAGTALQPPWQTEAQSLIVTFSIPACTVIHFAQNPRSTIGLIVRPTIAAAGKFAPKLGYELTVFRTELTDSERVFLLARCPVVGPKECVGRETGANVGVGSHWKEDSREEFHPEQDTTSSDIPHATKVDIHVQINETSTESAIQSFCARIDITDPDAKAALVNTQIVPKVKSRSGSAPSLDACVEVGTHAFSVQFPLPIDVRRAKLRVVRRSSYIEVVAPLASFGVKPERNLSYRLAPLSLSPANDGTPTLGSIHRVNLDRCPIFKLPKSPSESDWHEQHMCLMFSPQETKRALLGPTKSLSIGDNISTSVATPDTLLHVKGRLYTLLCAAAEATLNDPAPPKVFALCDSSRPGVPYLYIMVACMRLDVGSHTVVADAFVAPVTPAVRAAGPWEMNDITVHYADTGADETVAWFHLLPHLTERCRTWTHETGCTFRNSKNEGRKQLGSWEKKSPLCGCGEGVGTEMLPVMFQQVAPYLTRAAISPLFWIPYLKEVEIDPNAVEKKTQKGKKKHRKASKRDTQSQDENANVENTGYPCRTCRKEGDLTCSRCKRAYYCSKACQRVDWKEHKQNCKSVTKGRDD